MVMPNNTNASEICCSPTLPTPSARATRSGLSTSTLQAEAARYFSRYSKAKRATREITKRLKELQPELARLESKQAELERIVAARDENALAAFGHQSPDQKMSRVRARKE